MAIVVFLPLTTLTAEDYWDWHTYSTSDQSPDIYDVNALVSKIVDVHEDYCYRNFVESVILKNRFWTVARLLEKSLSSSENWGQKRFNAESLRCIALYRLCEIIQNTNKVKKGLAIAQANWVSSSTSIDKLLGTLNESIADAQITFANLAEPTPKQKALRAQLDQISQKSVKTKN